MRAARIRRGPRRGRKAWSSALLVLAALTAAGAPVTGPVGSGGAGGATAARFVGPTGPARLAAASVPATGCALSAEGAASATNCGVEFGMTLDAGTSTPVAAVAAQEEVSGQSLAIVHTYHRWLDVFPTASERALAASGHQLFINREPTSPGGAPMSWAAIASGRQDSVIDALAPRLASLPTVLLSFSHEPENNYGQHGTIASFVAAFRHVHDRLTADGVTNVKWVWDVMGLDNPVWRANYQHLYPGNAYVDWIAWDPYNWGSCRDEPWQSFAQITQPFYSWLMSHGFGDKPFMLAEFGTVERPGDPLGKASWFTAVPKALAAMPNLKAVVYFDVAAPPANCNWQITTSRASQRAFQQLAANPLFSGGA